MIAKTNRRAFVAAFGPALAALRLTLLMAGLIALGAMLRTTLPLRPFRPLLRAMLARRTVPVLLARRSLDRCSRHGFRRCFGARFAMFARLAARAARPLGAATAAFASTPTTAATAATAAVGRLEALDFQAGNLDAGNGRADQLLDRLHEIALGG